MTDPKEKSPGRILEEVIEGLCDPASYERVYYRHWQDSPMPSLTILEEIMERLRGVLFPGFFGKSDISAENMRYHVGSNLDIVFRLLSKQIERGLCFFCTSEDRSDCLTCADRAMGLTSRFAMRLPQIRKLLATDVLAAFQGDPAAKSTDEVIFCYPSIAALAHHRVAHGLHQLGVPVIPRIIAEMAHSKTGIDIHPGASIGEGFFIDHGTGTVVGETTIIGGNVRLYQGVTLGAKSFPRDAEGNPIKSLPRHPIVEDEVTIYAGATILGRITIGKGATIGGNVWVTEDVPPGARVVQDAPRAIVHEQRSGA
jgi:serine O-acetyltransferase